MTFFQAAPSLGNQHTADRVLRSYLARAVPPEALRDIEPTLLAMGELAGGSLYQTQLADRRSEPTHERWDAWGHRIDLIELSPGWKVASRVAAEQGVVATAYERRHAEYSRVHQFALAYLFHPSTDVYTCPLAMTDGAAKTLLTHRNQPLIDRAVSRLTSRDPARRWTSGQWMTERTGGSDVALTETEAKSSPEGWRLYGTKWFTSASTSEMALTLARPEGNPAGGSGLALFYLETRKDERTMNRIVVNRLKEKLGTRKVPTAELQLDGSLALPVAGLQNGVRNIAPMLNVTRTWNAICAIGFMRRGIALARDYAGRRHAFGAPLSHKPLHLETLADMQAEFEGAFHLAFRAVELLGREEAQKLTVDEADLLRLLTPIAKLTTAKQAVAVVSEALECMGGAGYVEDTGLPVLLRDAQVLPIWEGTTNVLSLDALRALQKGGALAALGAEIELLTSVARNAELGRAGQQARDAFQHARAWLAASAERDPGTVESRARQFALTLGRAYELAALVRHGQWSLDQEHDARATAAATRFARHGVDLLGDDSKPDRVAERAALANDEPLPH